MRICGVRGVAAAVLLGLAMGAGAQAVGVQTRSAALTALFKEMWEDRLKHSPEFASAIGDRRYNDQVSDESPKAIADALARDRAYLVRLEAIDTTGLTDQEKLSAQLMERQLVMAEEGARFKEWELPVNQFHGIHTDLPSEVSDFPFATVKDYDDYAVRLGKMPQQIRQATENLLAGIDDGRVQPAYLMEKVLKQTEELAANTPENSPFALPLKKFPASIGEADRKRISAAVLEAIRMEVLPAYVRFAKFMRSTEIPAARKEPGVWSMTDGDAYYAFCVRRSTTTDKTPAEIHQIGLDEVKRDEAEMLAIVKKLGYSDVKSFGAAMKANPKMHPLGKDDLLERYRGYEGGYEAEAAGAVRAAAEELARSGGDAGVPGERPGGGVVCGGHTGWDAAGAGEHQYVQRDRAAYGADRGGELSRRDSGASSSDFDCAGVDRAAGVSQTPGVHGVCGGLGAL